MWESVTKRGGEKSSFFVPFGDLWMISWVNGSRWRMGWRMTEWYWDRNEYGACLHSYTMEAGLRVYCICDPPFRGLGGGRCAGFRKVCLDMIILAIETGTSV